MAKNSECKFYYYMITEEIHKFVIKMFKIK